MAYQLKKKKHIIKQLELLDENNKPEMTLNVDIVVDDFRSRYPVIKERVIKAQQMLDENGDSDTEAIAASQIAMKAVFVLVFGEMQTRRFLEYYQNRYTEAFMDVIPFITEEVIPEVNKAVSDENARIIQLMA